MRNSIASGIWSSVQAVFTGLILASTMQQSATQILYQHRYIERDEVTYTQFVRRPPAIYKPHAASYFKGRLATLMELERDILFDRDPNYIYRHPDLYYPHCLQTLKRFAYSRKDCLLPVECGLSIIETKKDGWVSSEQLCIGIMTTQYPNVTHEVDERRQTHWAISYDIKFPESPKFHRLRVVLQNYNLLEYHSGSYQVVSKKVLQTLPKYDLFTNQLISPTTSILGEKYCLNRVKPQHQLVYAESNSPYKALLASDLFMYPDIENCPTGNQYYSITDGICEYKYNPQYLDVDCYIECNDVDVIRCDPEQDDWTPPSLIQAKIISTASWFARMFSTILQYTWQSLMKILSEAYYYLDRTWYITEYSILFTIAVIYLRGWVPAAAIIILSISVFGITRYGDLDH